MTVTYNHSGSMDITESKPSSWLPIVIIVIVIGYIAAVVFVADFNNQQNKEFETSKKIAVVLIDSVNQEITKLESSLKSMKIFNQDSILQNLKSLCKESKEKIDRELKNQLFSSVFYILVIIGLTIISCTGIIAIIFSANHKMRARIAELEILSKTLGEQSQQEVKIIEHILGTAEKKAYTIDEIKRLKEAIKQL